MKHLLCLVLCLCVIGISSGTNVIAAESSVVQPNNADFANPPAEYQPWVYWFWNNGNITKHGITADLEAMHRTGIKGVLIMEVGQGAPRGAVNFMKPQWRELFKFMISEANRLDIKVNMNNDAGWNGSGGWWIKPDEGMQILTWTETQVNQNAEQTVRLTKPKHNFGYYEDIAILAFPTPKDQTGKKAIDCNKNRRDPGDNKAVVEKNKVINLTKYFDAKTETLTLAPGGLALLTSGNPSAADCTILRIGHTAKNINVGPVPLSCVEDGGGRALECDKLSTKGADAAFFGQIGELTKDNKPLTGKTFVSTHIDSWENGSQNWTGKMEEEFQTLRHYDITPFLPVFAGYVVDNADRTDRFLWDFRNVVSELVLNRYARRFRELSHQHGIKLSIEHYGAPTDPIEYGETADEPMGEFWMGGGAFNTCKGAASAAHIYGKNIVGAEAFTSGGEERWLHHPGSIKTHGDRAFGEGIQRFVFHRYSMQPWADNIVPGGLMMGPWGLHYERSQTWWEQSKAWHEYLTRCQFMLRQGEYAADILYMENEELPQGYTGGFADHPRKGYQWDQCSAHLVKQLTTARSDSKDEILLVSPGGLKYKILVLPEQHTMTLELLEKLNELVKAGAAIIAKEPQGLPGLSYTKEQQAEFDKIKKQLFNETTVRRVGKGQILWGKTPEEFFAEQ
ncbi:MAG: hypothetical protein LBN39_04030, partial [Planctomycetaceae bacterium]|nr:hypothetical protein [Planctomycetaceae bacterium]